MREGLALLVLLPECWRVGSLGGGGEGGRRGAGAGSGDPYVKLLVPGRPRGPMADGRLDLLT